MPETGFRWLELEMASDMLGEWLTHNLEAERRYQALPPEEQARCTGGWEDVTTALVALDPGIREVARSVIERSLAIIDETRTRVSHPTGRVEPETNARTGTGDVDDDQLERIQVLERQVEFYRQALEVVQAGIASALNADEPGPPSSSASASSAQ
jgi:sigma54-dependent transcription regulator